MTAIRRIRPLYVYYLGSLRPRETIKRDKWASSVCSSETWICFLFSQRSPGNLFSRIHKYNTKTSALSGGKTKPVNPWACAIPALHAHVPRHTFTQMFGEIKNSLEEWILLTGTIEWLGDFCGCVVLDNGSV